MRDNNCGPRRRHTDVGAGKGFVSHIVGGVLLALCACGASYAAPVLPPGFALETYVSGIVRPVDIEWTADGSLLFVAEKRGRVMVVENGGLVVTPFINLIAEVNTPSDRGLLGIAVHPDFPSTPWLYLLYTYDPPETLVQIGNAGTNGQGQRVSRLIRVTADANNAYRTAVPGSEVVVLGTASTWDNIGDPAADQTDLAAPWTCGPAGAYIDDCIPADGLSHSIGTVQFGADGSLYVGNGDAASFTTVDPKAVRALHVDSLAGKIMRIDPLTGLGLPDNPFWDGNASSNRSRVWQLGLRNPYRFRLEPDSGRLWVGDVGWAKWEELNQAPPGSDFGWPCYEGGDGVLLEQPGYAALGECQDYLAANNAVAAPYAYLHVPGLGSAILAGEFYTHTKWPAEYRDKLFIADYALTQVHYVDTSGGFATVMPFATDFLTVDIALGPDGDLYTANLVDDSIERIVYTGNAPPETSVAIASASDDAEERANGHVFLNSPRLDMTFNHSQQTVGLRFDGVNVPPGTMITDTYIQFTTAQTSGDATTLTLRGETRDNAATFNNSTSNISSRPLTSAAVPWLPPPWTTVGQAGAAQRTPDLSAIVNEIIGRSGWAAGNSLALIVSGTGERVAWSYDGLANAAPQLHLAWNSPDNTPPVVTIDTPDDGTAFAQGASIAFSATATDAEDDDATLTVALTWTSNLDGVIGSGGGFTSNSLSIGTHTITASVADSAGDSGSASVSLDVLPNAAPLVAIDAPVGDEQWVVGDTVNYSGTATDAEDGALSGSALAWDAVIFHLEHQHVDLHSGSGTTGQFAYPDHDDDSFVRLCLSATDSAGASASTCTDLVPLEVTYTFVSNPPGLSLVYNTQAAQTPFSVLVAAGGVRQISAPSPQGAYVFDSWSIGGPATQQTTIATSNQTLTADFAAATWLPVASYHADFASSPAQDWSYRWNSGGPIGVSGGYQELLWNGSRYDSDGIAGLPDATELRYGHLTATGGHAGWGSAQGAAVDRYVIASYTVADSGDYRIVQSTVAQAGCQWSNGLDIQVLVNDGFVHQVVVPAGGAVVDFDTALGTLAAGDEIHVAAGPSMRDGCDVFAWDYVIERSPGGGPVNSPPLLTNPGTQTSTVGEPVSLVIVATDPDNDPLTYFLSGQPGGLNIDPNTGVVSGIPATPGSYTVTVSVSDGTLTASANFAWTIDAASVTWFAESAYGSDFASPSAPGWSYQWNAAAAIDNTGALVDLLWNGTRYDSDGIAGGPDASELRFGHLSQQGGHAGWGTAQGATTDRYVVAAYSVAASADYRIADSWIAQSGCQWSNGLDLRVYVNGGLEWQVPVSAGGATTDFNGQLGSLAAGDIVRVAAGPAARDGCDTFAWDFVIERGE